MTGSNISRTEIAYKKSSAWKVAAALATLAIAAVIVYMNGGFPGDLQNSIKGRGSSSPAPAPTTCTGRNCNSETTTSCNNEACDVSGYSIFSADQTATSCDSLAASNKLVIPDGVDVPDLIRDASETANYLTCDTIEFLAQKIGGNCEDGCSCSCDGCDSSAAKHCVQTYDYDYTNDDTYYDEEKEITCLGTCEYNLEMYGGTCAIWGGDDCCEGAKICPECLLDYADNTYYGIWKWDATTEVYGCDYSNVFLPDEEGTCVDSVAIGNSAMTCNQVLNCGTNSWYDSCVKQPEEESYTLNNQVPTGNGCTGCSNCCYEWTMGDGETRIAENKYCKDDLDLPATLEVERECDY